MQDEHAALKTIQMELAQQFAEDKPSEVTEVFWFYVISRRGPIPAPTSTS